MKYLILVVILSYQALASTDINYTCDGYGDRISIVEVSATMLRFQVKSWDVVGRETWIKDFLAKLNLSVASGMNVASLDLPISSCTIINNAQTYLLKCQQRKVDLIIDSEKVTLESVVLSIEDYDKISVGSFARGKLATIQAANKGVTAELKAYSSRLRPGCEK